MSFQAKPHIHPRHPLKTISPSSLTSLSSDPFAPSEPPSPDSPNRLRKSATFHSPISPPAEDRDPILSIPSLPRRSTACLDTLVAFAAGERRMATILNRLDLDSPSLSRSNNRCHGEDDLPVPRVILQAHVGHAASMASNQPKTTHMYGLLSPPMDHYPLEDQKCRQRATSDSGLGSSISSPTTRSIDESVERSMARRKKNAPPMNINQKCRNCDKVFKRPCDLTKHEKTHSRPWKCTEPSCKYFEIGWPTEKERDRHVNDRHSKSPPLYKCHFTPCTYQSKRESNCKQHMEKAHGWVYVRSKNNGKGSKGASSSAQATPQTPNIPTPISNITDFPTPISGPAPSPYIPFDGFSSPPPFSFNDLSGDPNSDFQLFPDHSGLEDVSATINDFDAFPSHFVYDTFSAQLPNTVDEDFCDYDLWTRIQLPSCNFEPADDPWE